MADERSFTSRVTNLRKQGQRAIQRLERMAANQRLDEATRDWAKAQKRDIASAIQGTRLYNPKTGKKYKSKTLKYREKQANRLEKSLQPAKPKYTRAGISPNKITEFELRRAAVDLPSLYTKEDVQLFYRVTQKVWQKKVKRDERNALILKYVNEPRRKNNLAPMTLGEIVDKILKENKDLSKVSKNADEWQRKGFPDEESKEAYANVERNDNADGEFGSPPGVEEKTIDTLRDVLASMFKMPDFTE